MGLSRLHWIIFCLLVFIISRAIMLYQYDLASNIFAHQHSSFFDVMCKWDCKWYLTIINDGYDLGLRTHPKVWKGLANWAFFPLYPYTVKIVATLAGTPIIATGVILNQIFILFSLGLFYRYLRLFVDEINSRFGVALLAFSPFSIYFASLYTEALFLLLSLTAFYLMRTQRPYLASLCGGLLSATRPVGVMFIIPYIYNQVNKYGFKLKIFWGCIIVISGLFSYMLYLQIHTGDFLAFKHVQKGWGRTGLDMKHLKEQMLFMLKDFHNSIFFIISLIISVYLLINKYVEEAVFNLLCILPGVMTGAMMSEARFSGTLFTFYFGLVMMFRKSNTYKIILAIIFLLFYVSYFLYWIAHAKFLI